MATASARAAAEEPFSVLDDEGRPLPGRRVEVEAATLLRMHRFMLLLRRLDERMLLLQRQGRIGFWGPTTGQEAATIGSVAALRPEDWVFPALREAGAALWRGLPLVEMVAQCLGNARDRTLGRQMPCHFSYREGRYVAMSSVIGTQLPHAVGAAMAAKIRGDDTISVGYLGDGATSAADFHTAMNFAAVFRAPCLLVCQNNQWAISVPLERQTAQTVLARKAVAYGMPGVRVDGNDAIAVHRATSEAAARARAGEGPTFLELVTYRLLGHSSSDDPERYRDPAEVERWKARDPIPRLQKYLLREGLLDEKALSEVEDEIQAEILSAVREAEKAPPPPIESLVTDVYAEVPRHLREQLEALRAIEG